MLRFDWSLASIVDLGRFNCLLASLMFGNCPYGVIIGFPSLTSTPV